VSPQGLRVRKFEKDFEVSNSILEYTFINSYPFSISAIPISYESSDLLKCTVSFSYLRYVVNELTATASTGSKQTPALNKLSKSFSDNFKNTAGPGTEFGERDTATGALMNGGIDASPITTRQALGFDPI